MKILIINYYYTPTVDAHAYRWAQIAQYWADAGHQVEVITGSVKGSPRKTIEGGVDVTRVGLVSKPNPATSRHNRDLSPIAKIRNVIIEVLRPAYRKIYWPDSLWHWLPSVAGETLRRRRVKYDLVISYYPCMAASLAVEALRVFAKYPDFRWIADYGDPFCASDTWQPNNYALYDSLNRMTERRIAKSAQLVFTNEATAAAYRKKLAIDENISVIPHLADIKKLYSQTSAKLKRSDTNETSILYIGGFHRNIREPLRLLDLMKKLNQVGERRYMLSIYGPKSEFDLAIRECPQVRYFGPIEREKAISLLQNADIIANVDNENCVMTPSKIIECISTGRPILNISSPSSYYGPLKKYTDIGYAHSVVEKDISDFTTLKVVEFIEFHSQKDSAPLEYVTTAIGEHGIEGVAGRYLELANDFPSSKRPAGRF